MAFLWLRESQIKEQETGISSRILCSDCTREDKKERGCQGGADWKLGKYSVDNCPENYLTDDNMRSIEVWQNWKMFGDYEFPGHRNDQPVWVIDSIKILEEASRSK